MDSKQDGGPRRPRAFSSFNPPPAPLARSSRNTQSASFSYTQGADTNTTAAAGGTRNTPGTAPNPFPQAPTTLYTQGAGYLPPAVPVRPPQDQANIDRVHLSMRHIDEEVVFIRTQVDDVLRDPNLADVREAARRIAMAARVLRWNFERILVLHGAASEENERLREEVRQLRAAAGNGEDAGMASEETASTEGDDTPAASTASSDGDNDHTI